jgi:hypothetical protein
MEDPSTIRRAVADIGRAPYGGDSLAGQTGGGEPQVMEQVMEQRTPFVPSSQYVLLKESQIYPLTPSNGCGVSLDDSANPKVEHKCTMSWGLPSGSNKEAV